MNPHMDVIRRAACARKTVRAALLVLAAIAPWMIPGQGATQPPERSGKQIVDAVCASCHGTGANGAPRIGDRKAWEKRAAQGLTGLTEHALAGVRKMPAHGGNPGLTDREIERAITYMVNQSGGRWIEPIDRSRPPAERSGRDIALAQCLKCHETGTGGAPRAGDRAAWVPRVKLGLDSLVRSAINGHGGMPPRGGMPDLTDAEFRAAIVFMFNADTAPAQAAIAPAAPRGQDYRIADRTTIHFGAVPARVIRENPKGYPASIARALPPGPDQYFVTIALFDADSGKRVADATVRARVAIADRSSPEKTLEATTIADSLTYGGFFAMPGSGRYTVAVRIMRPGAGEPIAAQFEYSR
jgi:cytochrome c5